MTLGASQYLDSLQGLVQALTQASDLTVILNQIMQQAVESIEAAGAGDIFLWEASSQQLRPRPWHNLGDWVHTVRLRLGEGVAGAAAQRREGLFVNDYEHSPYASTHFTRRLTHTAVMATPMLYRDTLLGAITVGNEGTGQPFTPEDLERLEVFAALATLATTLTNPAPEN